MGEAEKQKAAKNNYFNDETLNQKHDDYSKNTKQVKITGTRQKQGVIDL